MTVNFNRAVIAMTDFMKDGKDKHTMQKYKQPAVYILANKPNGTLYTGVTSDLPKRIYEHKTGTIFGFARRYGCKLLVCYAVYDDMENAIIEEKRIKGGSRNKKIRLIEDMNPEWRDLSHDI